MVNCCTANFIGSPFVEIWALLGFYHRGHLSFRNELEVFLGRKAHFASVAFSGSAHVYIGRCGQGS